MITKKAPADTGARYLTAAREVHPIGAGEMKLQIDSVDECRRDTFAGD